MSHEPRTATNRRMRPDRGFRTVDGMILVAVIATGFALSGWIASETQEFVSWGKLPSNIEFIRQMAALKPSSARNLTYAVSGLVLHMWMLATPLLATISIALIPIRLLPPRPRWRRLAVQPGTVAAWTTLLALVYVGTFYGTIRLVATKAANLTAADAAFALMCLPIFVGFSIFSAWTTLVVAGLWRAESTWIDRLGRIVAVAWVAAGLFNTYHYLIFNFTISVGSTIIQY